MALGIAGLAYGWLNNACQENDINKKEVLLEAARSRADSNYTKTIYNLCRQYEIVTPEMVKEWVEAGRIPAESEEDFLRYIGEL